MLQKTAHDRAWWGGVEASIAIITGTFALVPFSYHVLLSEIFARDFFVHLLRGHIAISGMPVDTRSDL